VSRILFKNRDGQTPLPIELRKGLKPKNIQTIGDLDEYEEQNLTKGLIWLEKQDSSKTLDRYFWFELHKKLFGEVWSWAGKVRVHELMNPDFVSYPNIQVELKKLEESLKFWVSNNSYNSKFIIARVHERLLTIHPFPNGNGRFSRIACEKLAEHLESSRPLWGSIYKEDSSKRRAIYVESIELARKQNKFEPLKEFIFS
jgi:Fic-DOC domain mobile mystery protein B